MPNLADKIGRMMLVGFDGLSAPEHILDWLASGRIGGVYLFARNVASPAQVQDLVAECREAANQPILVGIDQEGGIVARLRAGFTQSPGNMALGAARDPALAEEMAFVLGREMAALGINWNFAPVADIAHQPDNPSVSTRSVGRDAELVSEIVSAQIRGYQRAGVAATVKHFPGLGNTVIDTHEALARVSGSLDYLYQEDLLPFRRAIESDVACVMITHVLFEAMDSRYPSTLSPRIVNGLLRAELGFEGAVCTDCMEMKAVRDGFGPGESAVLTILAGVDLPLFSHTRRRQEQAYRATLKAAQSGRIPMERIDRSLARIGALIDRYTLDSAPSIDCVASAEHQAIAMRAARAGIALVTGPDALPLDPATENLAVIEFTLGRISDAVEAEAGAAFSICLGERLPQVRRHLIDPARAAKAQAQDLVNPGDTVILATRNAHMRGAQQALAEAIIQRAKSTILVAARNPYDATLPDADIALCTHGDSPPSLRAAVEAICGDFVPTGKTPVNLA